jgi:hypothetical protein
MGDNVNNTKKQIEQHRILAEEASSKAHAKLNKSMGKAQKSEAKFHKRKVKTNKATQKNTRHIVKARTIQNESKVESNPTKITQTPVTADHHLHTQNSAKQNFNNIQGNPDKIPEPATPGAPSTKGQTRKYVGRALNKIIGRQKTSEGNYNINKKTAFLAGVGGAALIVGTGGVAPLAYGAYQAYKNRGDISKITPNKPDRGSDLQKMMQKDIETQRKLSDVSMIGVANALTAAKGMAIKETMFAANRATYAIGTMLQGTKNEKNKNKSLAVRATKGLVPKELRKPIGAVKTAITQKLGLGKNPEG